MKVPLPTIPHEIPTVCRMLRTKNAYHNYPEDDPNHTPWQLAESTTAVYWCLKTMRAAGPDGDLVLPEECTDERVCFEPAVRRGGES